MKGDAQPLIKFFDGSDKRFIIPLYQRNYDWKEDNCEQLFQDLIKLHNSDRKSHFFGSIVSSIQSGGKNGVCPPTWSGLIHPLSNWKTA